MEAIDPAPGSPVAGSVRLEFGDTEITASAAITVDSTSIVYTGYTNSSGNFLGAVRNYATHEQLVSITNPKPTPAWIAFSIGCYSDT